MSTCLHREGRGCEGEGKIQSVGYRRCFADRSTRLHREGRGVREREMGRTWGTPDPGALPTGLRVFTGREGGVRERERDRALVTPEPAALPTGLRV